MRFRVMPRPFIRSGLIISGVSALNGIRTEMLMMYVLKITIDKEIIYASEQKTDSSRKIHKRGYSERIAYNSETARGINRFIAQDHQSACE